MLINLTLFIPLQKKPWHPSLVIIYSPEYTNRDDDRCTHKMILSTGVRTKMTIHIIYYTSYYYGCDVSILDMIRAIFQIWQEWFRLWCEWFWLWYEYFSFWNISSISHYLFVLRWESKSRYRPHCKELTMFHNLIKLLQYMSCYLQWSAVFLWLSYFFTPFCFMFIGITI